jgi:hypothetical protein
MVYSTSKTVQNVCGRSYKERLFFRNVGIAHLTTRRRIPED